MKQKFYFKATVLIFLVILSIFFLAVNLYAARTG
jgi:hypothetical protein